jgi:hypothetical protein
MIGEFGRLSSPLRAFQREYQSGKKNCGEIQESEINIIFD